MKRVSPTLEGFGVMLRCPTIGLAELSWRWTFSCALVFLFTISFLEFLNTLPVSNADLFLLKTRQPFLIWQAVAHILRGSALHAWMAVIVLSIAVPVAWILLASLGRAATLRTLVYRVRAALNAEGTTLHLPAVRFQTLLGLNVLRMSVFVAGSFGCVAAVLLFRAVSSHSDAGANAAFFLALLVLLVVATAAALLNWFLSLASIFACRVEVDTLSALAAAVQLCRDRLGAVLASSSWFGLAHTAAFFAATSIVALPLGFAGLLPPAAVAGGVLALTLLYFAAVDFLYIGRLAAYVAIAEMPERSEAVASPPPPLTPILSPQQVDQDELILSDIPLFNPASS